MKYFIYKIKTSYSLGRSVKGDDAWAPGRKRALWSRTRMRTGNTGIQACFDNSPRAPVPVPAPARSENKTWLFIETDKSMGCPGTSCFLFLSDFESVNSF